MKPLLSLIPEAMAISCLFWACFILPIGIWATPTVPTHPGVILGFLGCFALGALATFFLQIADSLSD